jgi:hypothetical protein
MTATKYIPPRPPAEARRRPLTSETMEILSHATGERGALHLLRGTLRLTKRSRLLVLHPPTRSARRALALLVHNATLLGIEVLAFEADRVSLLGGTGREELDGALRTAHACMTLETGSGEVGAALEQWLCDHVGNLPSALLRFDAEALLTAPARTEGVGLGSLDRGPHHDLDLWLSARLERAKHLELEDGLGTRMTLELEHGARPAGARQVAANVWRYPSPPASAAVHTIAGKLVAPRVFMPDGTSDGHTPLRSFQFRDGALRGVEGPHGATWMREAMQQVPGLFVTRVAFGTCQRDANNAGEAFPGEETRPATFERPGCVITLLDPRLSLTDRTDSTYRGISFCVASDTLSMRLDGTPIVRAGRYTDAVRRLASSSPAATETDGRQHY